MEWDASHWEREVKAAGGFTSLSLSRKGYYLSSEVQFGQRTAFSGIVERQKGHSLVSGAAGAGALLRRLI